MKKSPARNDLLKKGPSKLLEKINSSIELDARLYNEDIKASIAHARMLTKTKIISDKEGKKIIFALQQILRDIEKGKVRFNKKYEDIHMNIEALLQKKIGTVAGKLHTARSRNDQVVTDFKLWIKKHSLVIDKSCQAFQKALIGVAKKKHCNCYARLYPSPSSATNFACSPLPCLRGNDWSRSWKTKRLY